MTKLSEDKKRLIRARRETEFFPIYNRAEGWKRRLTQAQRDELESLYQQWLDAPETGIIPILPKWVNEKTKPEEILL